MNVTTITEPRRAAEVVRETSAVSWGAIIAGAFATSSLVLILFLLGAALGLLSTSPWTNAGASAVAIGIAGAVWLIIVHALSSGFGGFIAGRLRTKWSDVARDEVYFRDTAHGFLAWAVSTIAGVMLLSAIASSAISGSAQVGAKALGEVGRAATTAAAQAAGQEIPNIADPTGYLVDTLFRSEQNNPEADDSTVRAEMGRILATSIAAGDMSKSDRAYLAQVVSSRTGFSQPEAEKRVSDMIVQAKDMKAKAEATARSAADTARKAAAYLSLWTFIAMLIGAFSASYAATIGGRIRDA